MTKNKLLKRQLKKAGIDTFESLNEESFKQLIKYVEQSYEDNVESRRMIDHSLDIASQEMRDVVEELESAHRDAEKKDRLMFQQSRLAQMGEMISMIAHQWRQPLNMISITSANIQFQILLGNTDIDKKNIIEATDSITKYVHHLSDTIDDFRDFFKPTKEIEVTNFCSEVKSVLTIIENSIREKKIEIIKDLNCKSNFKTYSNELKHVIINLIKNAEDILVEKKIKDPYIKIRTYREADSRILEVSDNGGGVPKDIIDKIFDPYFSTKTKQSGTGLGLYMSKIIIQEHCNAQLDVKNDKYGAVFRIIFPV